MSTAGVSCPHETMALDSLDPAASLLSSENLNNGNESTGAHAGNVATEHLALIGFTARLGTNVTNADAEDTATREEARLLMSLLGRKERTDGSDDGNEEIRPSSSGSSAAALLCDEVMDGGEDDGKPAAQDADDSGPRPDSPDNSGSFSFSCPSLSIEPSTGGHAAARPYASPLPRRGAGAAAMTPSELFRRPLTASGREDVTPTAEAVAINAMRAFGAAAEWRGRAWMQSLGDVLSLREKLAAQGRGQERLRELQGDLEAEDEQLEEEEAADSASSAGSSSEQDGGGGGGGSEGCDASSDAEEDGEEEQESGDQDDEDGEEEEEIQESNELKVIYALARSISRIQIKSVHTSFRVLPERMHLSSNDGEEIAADDTQEFVLITPEAMQGDRPAAAPPPKKRRFRQVSCSPTQDSTGPEGSERKLNGDGIGGRYQVEHGLLFEATLRVSLPQENGLQQEQEIVLSAPGSVRGTFHRAADGLEGMEVLCAVHVKLDTDVLALSMERTSRMIVRRAAEADMLACATEAQAEEEYETQEYACGQAPQSEECAYAGAPAKDFAQPPMYATPYDHETIAGATDYQAYYYSASTSPAESSYPQAAVVTPKHYASPPLSFSSGGSVREITEDLTMPPPSDDPRTGSNAMSSPTEFVDYSLPAAASKNYLFSPGAAGMAPPAGTALLPSLVSPSPTSTAKRVVLPGDHDVPAQNGGGVAACQDGSSAGASEADGRGGRARSKGVAPSLPALVEVACAAMCST